MKLLITFAELGIVASDYNGMTYEDAHKAIATRACFYACSKISLSITRMPSATAFTNFILERVELDIV